MIGKEKGMDKELVLAIELRQPEMAEKLVAMAQRLTGVRVVRWFDSIGEKGQLAVGAIPDVILIDDGAPNGSVLEHVARLRRAFPGAAVFVVSPQKAPEHIVQVMKAGATEFLAWPVTGEVLGRAVESERRRRAAAPAAGRIFSFIASKGGIGSTTTCVNTAVALAEKSGRGVALVDLSLQAGDIPVLLDLTPQSTIVDCARNLHRLDASFLHGAVTRHASGVELLAAPLQPEESEEVRGDQVARILEELAKNYALVLVDCASMHVSDSTVEVFRISEKIFILLDLSVPAIRNACRLAQLIAKTGTPADRVEFVVNRYSRHAALSVEEGERVLKKRLHWLFPNDFDQVIGSINRGVPLVQLHPGGQLARSIGEFADGLLHPSRHSEFRGVRGTFGQAI